MLNRNFKMWVRNNGLLLTLAALFALSFAGQIATGLASHNSDLQNHERAPISLADYLVSGHFIEATFENWESEFLQMGVYVVLTAFLFQKGSAESNPLPGEGPKKGPSKKRFFVRQPWLRRVYENSLSLVLLALFCASFLLHLYGGWREENLKRSISPRHQTPQTMMEFLRGSDFWFQSFQNWQSEFLSVGAIVYLSIYLRQKNSSQSKDVDAPHDETGD